MININYRYLPIKTILNYNYIKIGMRLKVEPIEA